MKKIKRILVSVYNKEPVIPLIKILDNLGLEIISTGGTKEALEKNNIKVLSVESITEYPSILGGRVKTLHPKIFGGILRRDDTKSDMEELHSFSIPQIDMVIVDLYPFEETVKSGGAYSDIIEKIDIGGVSLIRAAAKNYNDVLVISSIEMLQQVVPNITAKNGHSSLEERRHFAAQTFQLTAHYEIKISNFFNNAISNNYFQRSVGGLLKLRYGENPHQKGFFYGNIKNMFEQLGGKELSYNNLLDSDAAISLMSDFTQSSFGILKHNNACGFCSNNNIATAFKRALESDPVSAFGGVLISNKTINKECADEINKLFFEIIIAPDFSSEALSLLKSKKNRIILKKKNLKLDNLSYRTVLNGVLCQDKDNLIDGDSCKIISKTKPSEGQMKDLLFASKICKHTKSNTIVLAKNNQLLASGCGQTSRVDALKQAIQKAKNFGQKLDGAVMASDAFFPFPDCVEIAHNAGIRAIIQPGGSKNDHLSIDYCNNNKLAMVFTGIRHFKH